MSVAAASHTSCTSSTPFLGSFAPARRTALLEADGAEFAHVGGTGVAEMDITEEAAQALEEGIPGKGSAAEGHAGRMRRMLQEQEIVAKSEDARDQSRFSADPRDQILALYDEYRPRLFLYLRSLHLAQDQAEEIIQETFMRLTTGLLRKDEFDNVQGWIVRVAHNLAIDARKRQGRDAIQWRESADSEMEQRVDPASSPEAVLLAKERKRRMDAALATFNPQQRQCFHMRVQGFHYKEIGAALGISEQRAAFVLKQVTVRLAAICG